MDAVTSYLQTQYTNKLDTANATKAKSSVGGISENSSREEIESAVKSFETYFAEQVIKEFKDSTKSINGDNESSISMYTDYFMEGTISTLASQLVDQLGGKITDDFVDQIMRNYGIKDEAVDEEIEAENTVEE